MFEGLFQPLHLVLILGIALIIFGPGKIAGLGGALGKSIGDFKKAMKDNSNDVKDEISSINRSLLEDHPVAQAAAAPANAQKAEYQEVKRST